jgi:hypothetical protein
MITVYPIVGASACYIVQNREGVPVKDLLSPRQNVKASAGCVPDADLQPNQERRCHLGGPGVGGVVKPLHGQGFKVLTRESALPPYDHPERGSPVSRDQIGRGLVVWTGCPRAGQPAESSLFCHAASFIVRPELGNVAHGVRALDYAPLFPAIDDSHGAPTILRMNLRFRFELEKFRVQIQQSPPLIG